MTQITTHDIALVCAIRSMEQYGKPCNTTIADSRLQAYLDTLNESLKMDGPDGFERSKVVLFNGNPNLAHAYATYSEESETPESKLFEFLEFKGLANLPKPEWLLYDVLPNKGINFLYGKEGCGKTYVATGIAVAVASRLAWLGRATKHGSVLIVAAEDIDEVAQRFIGAAHYYALDDIPNLHIYPAPLSLATDAEKLIESLDFHYPDAQPLLIIVDTLAMCSIGIEENSAKEFGMVIGALEKLWRRYNCCIIAVHHSGKNGEMRGTSAMDGVAYSKILVEEVDENIRLHSVKKRRGKPFDDIYLDRKIVEIPGQLDEEANPVTTCVLIKSDRVQGADPAILTKLQQEIIQHLTNRGGVDVARTEVLKACLIERGKDRSFCNAISGLIQKGILKQAKEKQRTLYSLMKTASETGTDVLTETMQFQ